MDVDEIQTQGCKFPRIGNGRIDSNKIGQNGEEQYPDDDDDRKVKRSGGGGVIGAGGAGSLGRLCGWPSSRIVRVSRATGGKDRHSKVLTSKGLRDRRVRLSVATAIQFYDLQDRLGYDQPSKAVEWLLKAAANPIAELPSINSSFPDSPKQLSEENRSSAGTEQGFDSAEVEFERDPNYQQQQHVSLEKSACSSTSETSKGSGLSLSRSESRIKARERARGRTAEKEKEKENESGVANHPNANPISQSSFTELLTGGISSVGNNTTNPNESAQQNPGGGEPNLFNKSTRHWSLTPMDYFASGLLGQSSSRTHHSSPGFSDQSHLGNSLPQSMTSPFNVSGDHHQELQHFSFVPDHLVPVTTPSGGSDYNLNFTISSGVAGFNRGTLQSNSPSLLPHLQRFSPIDGSNVPFFIGPAAPIAAPVENHHQFPPGFDGRLQLYYGDGGRHSDHKGKGKN